MWISLCVNPPARWPALSFHRLTNEQSPPGTRRPGQEVPAVRLARAGSPVSWLPSRGGYVELSHGRHPCDLLSSSPMVELKVRAWCPHPMLRAPRRLRWTAVTGLKSPGLRWRPHLSLQAPKRPDSVNAVALGPQQLKGIASWSRRPVTASCRDNVAVHERKGGGFSRVASRKWKQSRGRCSAANEKAPPGRQDKPFDLEMEIFDFMLKSGSPDSFPTQQELAAAGRSDLVQAVKREGGWLAIGWAKEPVVQLATPGSRMAPPEFVDNSEPSVGRGSGDGMVAYSRDTWRESSGQEATPTSASSRGATRDILSEVLGFDPREGSQDSAPAVTAPDVAASDVNGQSGRQLEDEADGEQDALTAGSSRWDERKQPAQLRIEEAASAGGQSLDESRPPGDESQPESTVSDQQKEASPRKKRRPKGYWQKDENLERELREYCAGAGQPDSMPSVQELREARRADLAMAVSRRGGWKLVAALFGLKPHAIQGSPKEGRQHRFVPRELASPAERETDPAGPAAQAATNGRAPTVPSGKLLEGGNVIDFSVRRPPVAEAQSPAGGGRAAGGHYRERQQQMETNPRKKRRKKRRKPLPPGAPRTVQEASGNMSNRSLGLDLGLGLAGESQQKEAVPAGDRADGSQPQRTVNGTNGAAQVAAPRSMSERIRALESSLVSTRAALQSSRESLLSSGEDARQVREATMQELVQVTESLEFRESEIMRTRLELRQTRAEVMALEGRLAADFRDARRALEEGPAEVGAALESVVRVRPARVVWPNPALEVLLTGSFDNWTNHIRMERSSAGVFVTTLQLMPGRYEIKFIVDGTWKVDPHRQIVYFDGVENNLLIVS